MSTNSDLDFGVSSSYAGIPIYIDPQLPPGMIVVHVDEAEITWTTYDEIDPTYWDPKNVEPRLRHLEASWERWSRTMSPPMLESLENNIQKHREALPGIEC